MALVDGDAVRLCVELAYGVSPREVLLEALTIPAGSTLAQALQASALVARHGLEPGTDAGSDALTVGIWGRQRPLDTPLREGDRIELYRSLQVDPKQARRQRQRNQAGKAEHPKQGGEAV